MSQTTVAILHAGDMGTALGRLLLESGVRVVTTSEGRGLETDRRGRSAGMEVLSGYDAVAEEADIVISLVPPMAALEVAGRYAQHLGSDRRSGPIFVEANAVDLGLLRHIGSFLADRRIDMVDAAIHGGAHCLQELGVLYLSGPLADRVEAAMPSVLRVESLGERIGSATVMKQMLSAMSKSLAASFLEVAVLAEHNEVLPAFLENCRHFYPGVLGAVERTLPTYPRHAARRGREVRRMVESANASESPSGVLEGAAELIESMAAMDWNPSWKETYPGLSDLVRYVAHSVVVPSVENQRPNGSRDE